MQRLSLTVSAVALFVSLTMGGAVAGGIINGSSIKRGSIPADRLTPGAQAKFSKPGPRGPAGYDGAAGLNGAMGAPGVQGPSGINGPPGGFDPSRVSYVTGPSLSVAPGVVATATATCPAGTVAIAGGFFSSITHAAYSNGNAASWSVIVNNDSLIPVNVNAYAVCAAR